MDRPWFQLHTRDLLDCKELARCDESARMILVWLMCLAHEGVPYGHLADDVGALTDEYMASRCVVRLSVFRRSLAALEKAVRLLRTPDGILYVPRMVRDEEVRLKRAAGGNESRNNPRVPRRKDGGEGYQEGYPSGGPSGGPSDESEGYPPPRAHADVRSDSDSVGASGLLVLEKENLEGNGKVPLRTPITDPEWFEFRDTWQRYRWAQVSVEDWHDAERFGWSPLDSGQRLDAIMGLFLDLIGKDNTLPANYLKKRKWTRGVRTATEAKRTTREQSNIDAVNLYLGGKR